MAPKTATAQKPTKVKSVVIESPDTEEVEKDNSVIVSNAKAMTVTSQPEHHLGLEFLKSLAIAEKRVKDLFAESKDFAHKAHKAITEAEKKMLLPIAEAKSIVTQKVLKFQIEEQKKAEELQRQAQEAARKAEEERALADAIEAEASGDKAAAEQIIAAPISVPTVTVAPNVAEVEGISSRVYYRCKVVNLLELVKYVAANPHEISLLQPDETVLRKRAESMKEGFRLPGCELDKQQGLAVRSA